MILRTTLRIIALTLIPRYNTNLNIRTLAFGNLILSTLTWIFPGTHDSPRSQGQILNTQGSKITLSLYLLCRQRNLMKMPKDELLYSCSGMAGDLWLVGDCTNHGGLSG